MIIQNVKHYYIEYNVDTKEVRSLLMRELFFAKRPLSLLYIQRGCHYPASIMLSETLFLQERGYITYDEATFVISLTTRGYSMTEDYLRTGYEDRNHQDNYFESKKNKQTVEVFEPYLPNNNVLGKLMECEDIANRTRSESLRTS